MRVCTSLRCLSHGQVGICRLCANDADGRAARLTWQTIKWGTPGKRTAALALVTRALSCNQPSVILSTLPPTSSSSSSSRFVWNSRHRFLATCIIVAWFRVGREQFSGGKTRISAVRTRLGRRGGWQGSCDWKKAGGGEDWLMTGETLT